MMIKDLTRYAYGFLIGVVLAAFVLAVSLLVSLWYIEHEVAELSERFFLIERLDRLEAAQDSVTDNSERTARSTVHNSNSE